MYINDLLHPKTQLTIYCKTDRILRIGKSTTLSMLYLQNTLAKFLFVAFNEAIIICSIFSAFFLMVAKAHNEYYHNT